MKLKIPSSVFVLFSECSIIFIHITVHLSLICQCLLTHSFMYQCMITLNHGSVSLVFFLWGMYLVVEDRDYNVGVVTFVGILHPIAWMHWHCNMQTGVCLWNLHLLRADTSRIFLLKQWRCQYWCRVGSIWRQFVILHEQLDNYSWTWQRTWGSLLHTCWSEALKLSQGKPSV